MSLNRASKSFVSSDAPDSDPGCGDAFVHVLLLVLLDFLILPCSHMLITAELVSPPFMENCHFQWHVKAGFTDFGISCQRHDGVLSSMRLRSCLPPMTSHSSRSACFKCLSGSMLLLAPRVLFCFLGTLRLRPHGFDAPECNLGRHPLLSTPSSLPGCNESIMLLRDGCRAVAEFVARWALLFVVILSVTTDLSFDGTRSQSQALVLLLVTISRCVKLPPNIHHRNVIVDWNWS